MRFVFVHGGFHAAWCWERTIGELVTLGHGAVAVDLPGHGTRLNAASRGVTFEDRAISDIAQLSVHFGVPAAVFGGDEVPESAGLSTIAIPVLGVTDADDCLGRVRLVDEAWLRSLSHKPTGVSIVMVEGGAEQANEADMIDALMFAKEAAAPLIALQDRLRELEILGKGDLEVLRAARHQAGRQALHLDHMGFRGHRRIRGARAGRRTGRTTRTRRRPPCTPRGPGNPAPVRRSPWRAAAR